MASKERSCSVDWINLLFRGDKSLKNCSDDEYVAEFASKNLLAKTIPVLDFYFKNIDELSKLIVGSSDLDSDSAYGLIITSPRVVEGLARAVQYLGDRKSEAFGRFNLDLVFVVGEKTSKECDTKLGLKHNLESSKSGNGQSLARYIKSYCNNIKVSVIKLLYPKSSLSGNLIEDELGSADKIIIDSLIIYETKSISSLKNLLIEELQELKKEVLNSSRKLIINMIFFSPSGVQGFLNNRVQFDNMFPSRQVDILYSTIGPTTEAFMSKNNLQVYCVAEKPNPKSLVECLLKKGI